MINQKFNTSWKCSPLCLLTLFLCSGTITANTLDVEFSGQLIATSCRVVLDSVNKEVKLNSLRLKNVNENEASAVTPFTLDIEKCSNTDLNKTIKLTWQSTQLITVGGREYVKTQGDAGILLGLNDKDGNAIVWHKPMILGAVTVVEDVQQLEFGVFARKPATGDAKAGGFTGTTTFSVDYE